MHCGSKADPKHEQGSIHVLVLYWIALSRQLLWIPSIHATPQMCVEDAYKESLHRRNHLSRAI
eukprot:1159770-Pelagomonas_calceolata.AAC.11